MGENLIDKQERSQMRVFLHAHPDGPMEYQADDLVTMSCVLENTEAEIEGMKDVKSRGARAISPHLPLFLNAKPASSLLMSSSIIIPLSMT